MKNGVILLSAIALLVLGCSPSGDDSEVAKLKEQLTEKRDELKELESEIKGLEAAIVGLDPSFEAYERTARLITTTPATQGLFEHFVQVRGNVASRTNVTMSAESAGTVARIHVREGQYVQQGQTLVSLDANILAKSIEEIKKNLELAETLYEKQKALWEDGIGTEVQYLQSKNQFESLKARLASTQAQYALSITKAPFSGRIDQIMINPGQQIMPGTPILRLVGDRDMYLEADLSEKYIGAFEEGDSVSIYLPSLHDTTYSVVSSMGEVINPLNRTITVEIKLPKVPGLKPNMLAVVKLKDYSHPNAVMVPNNLIQTDRDGDFIFVAVKDAEAGLVADKVRITRGRNYEGMAEVTSGLTGDEVLIDEGFREVVDGAFVKLAEQEG